MQTSAVKGMDKIRFGSDGNGVFVVVLHENGWRLYTEARQIVCVPQDAIYTVAECRGYLLDDWSHPNELTRQRMTARADRRTARAGRR